MRHRILHPLLTTYDAYDYFERVNYCSFKILVGFHLSICFNSSLCLAKLLICPHIILFSKLNMQLHKDYYIMNVNPPLFGTTIEWTPILHHGAFYAISCHYDLLYHFDMRSLILFLWMRRIKSYTHRWKIWYMGIGKETTREWRDYVKGVKHSFQPWMKWRGPLNKRRTNLKRRLIKIKSSILASKKREYDAKKIT